MQMTIGEPIVRKSFASGFSRLTGTRGPRKAFMRYTSSVTPWTRTILKRESLAIENRLPTLEGLRFAGKPDWGSPSRCS